MNNCVKIPGVYVYLAYPSAVRVDLGSELIFAIESSSENHICNLHLVFRSLETLGNIPLYTVYLAVTSWRGVVLEHADIAERIARSQTF